uniref:Uncharacterized protein n=1 Tax=Leersia perrieri TaxID=77586 RepID=A0A0D9XSR8_9ORYZ
MEKHKCRATANMVNRSGKTLEEFIAAVEEIKEQLMDAYENLDDKWRHGTSFVEMMLADGCFLLEMRIILQIVDDGGTVETYGPNDPVFSKHGFLYSYTCPRVSEPTSS